VTADELVLALLLPMYYLDFSRLFYLETSETPYLIICSRHVKFLRKPSQAEFPDTKLAVGVCLSSPMVIHNTSC